LRAVQSSIISRAEAKKRKIKPSCEVDAFPVCESFIAGGLKSCKADYCEICPEAHSCDHTCDLPCAGGVDSGANGLCPNRFVSANGKPQERPFVARMAPRLITRALRPGRDARQAAIGCSRS
jgi:hypothetical protein